ncbi:MAG TPA: two-component regulator propeller domain-containing protein, partial [Pyrinomonadaceae bacterium]|nr:two-component regulator propeller domain-containing protein [Pyrinomonadaceae bacterium]
MSSQTASAAPAALEPRLSNAGRLGLIVLSVLLLFALCLLPSLASFAQVEPAATPSPSPFPSPSPSPSPSPTPVTGLHQWGAVTLFHGLPSDRVHAIAQGTDGAMWFGTDAGLAKFDGRRTQTTSISGLAPGRILALQSDDTGALWVGTETGAARMMWGRFDVVKETEGQAVGSIIAPEHGRVVMATEQGNIYESRTEADGSFQTKSLLTQPLQSADREHVGP